MRLHTARLELVPATAASIRTEIENPSALAALLGASVPDNWPPESLAEALPWFLQSLEAAPQHHTGWLCWYALRKGEGGELPVLVASAGFLGPPQRDAIAVDTSEATVELGYEVLTQFQRQGYGTEMVGALVDWALAQGRAQRIVADVLPSNVPSVRLLHRLGFIENGMSGGEPNYIHFQRTSGRNAN